MNDPTSQTVVSPVSACIAVSEATWKGVCLGQYWKSVPAMIRSKAGIPRRLSTAKVGEMQGQVRVRERPEYANIICRLMSSELPLGVSMLSRDCLGLSVGSAWPLDLVAPICVRLSAQLHTSSGSFGSRICRRMYVVLGCLWTQWTALQRGWSSCQAGPRPDCLVKSDGLACN